MRRSSTSGWYTLSFAVAIFSGAFLLFGVEPMIGKYLLPWFGGSPEVWTTCMLFFQVFLLAGYLYAHLSSRLLSPAMQAGLHVLLLAAAGAMLPMAPEAHWHPQDVAHPVARILWLLTAALGLPYMVLAATSPLVQSWFARGGRGTNPYRLYALSNAGSLLALVSYPLAVEPFLSRQQQVTAWSEGWAGFAVLSAGCAIWAWRRGRGLDEAGGEGLGVEEQSRGCSASLREPRHRAAQQKTAAGGEASVEGVGRTVLWYALPAASSLMLLSITNKISLDLAVVPFLWVLPLCLYLLTFILCFAGERWYSRGAWMGVFVVAIGGTLWLRVNEEGMPVPWQIGVYLADLLAGCMVCHGELYRLRAAPAKLTAYYLAIAVGGALGGFFAAVIAPLIFQTYMELFLGLLGTCLLAILAQTRAGLGRRKWLWTGLIVSACIMVPICEPSTGARGEERVLRQRNFYGVLTLWDSNADPGGRRFVLQHGTTKHGVQFADPARRRQPTAYYGPASGGGLALGYLEGRRPLRVGVVGLGVGTLAAYGREGDVYRFYEINPAVVELARSRFTYLADSPAKIEVVLGDARNSLQQEPSQQFDLLVLDAFSSDAIPVHLLTREAFEVYLRHLRGGGVLAVHISSVHLDLESVVFGLAEHFGLTGALIESDEIPSQGILAATWVLATTDEAFLSSRLIGVATAGQKRNGRAVRLWTDDRVSLLDVLK